MSRQKLNQVIKMKIIWIFPFLMFFLLLPCIDLIGQNKFAIEPVSIIRITIQHNKASYQFEGTIVRQDTNYLVFKIKNHPKLVRIPYIKVMKLEVKRGSSRIKNGLLGSVIGFFVGAALFPETEKFLGPRFMNVPTSVIGGVAGVLIAGEHWEEVPLQHKALKMLATRFQW
jgi:hypothetical protein